MLISELNDGAAMDTDPTVLALGRTTENKEGFCPLTGARTFAEAVTAILASKELAQSIIAINVSREIKEAQITYRDISKGGLIPSSSKFGGVAEQPEEPGMSLNASLSGYVLDRMADIFAFDKGEARP